MTERANPMANQRVRVQRIEQYLKDVAAREPVLQTTKGEPGPKPEIGGAVLFGTVALGFGAGSGYGFTQVSEFRKDQRTAVASFSGSGLLVGVGTAALSVCYSMGECDKDGSLYRSARVAMGGASISAGVGFMAMPGTTRSDAYIKNIFGAVMMGLGGALVVSGFISPKKTETSETGKAIVASFTGDGVKIEF